MIKEANLVILVSQTRWWGKLRDRYADLCILVNNKLWQTSASVVPVVIGHLDLSLQVQPLSCS